MIKKTLLPFLLTLSTFICYAQNSVSKELATSYTWTNYKLGFQAPADFTVKENSSTVYYGGNDHIYLTIYPKKGDTLTHDNLPVALKKWATGHKVSFSSANAGYLTNNNRLWNYYVSGSGYKGMSIFVAVLVDSSNPENSYYIWLQYQNGYADAALSILNSFSVQ